MRRSWRYIALCAPFMVAAFLMVPFGQRRAVPMPPSLPMEHWDIPQLVAYLNEVGLYVRVQPAQKNGQLGSGAYLTIGKTDWNELNHLTKDPRQIARWRGVVYCERPRPIEAMDLIRQWGEHCLAIEPFLFYGDAELLARIKTALERPIREFAP